jgi:hypothetical protein
MEALQRMNASTTEDLEASYEEFVYENRTKVFKLFFGVDYVYKFFDGMLRYQRPETMDAFAQYHSEEHLKFLMENVFPDPDMYDMWNAWDRLGRPTTH